MGAGSLLLGAGYAVLAAAAGERVVRIDGVGVRPRQSVQLVSRSHSSRIDSNGLPTRSSLPLMKAAREP